MHPVPTTLLSGPFSTAQARQAGVTKKMLEGRRFVQVYRGVWRHHELAMTGDHWREAARLAMPAHAHLTGISRLQHLGLDFGPRLPVRFVVQGDLHLAFDNVFLHRTKQVAPTDDVGVVPAAAFIAYCARTRVIDAIKVGDWLLHHGHTTLDEIRTLALFAPWRAGADEALWLLEHLDGRSRSLMESETRPVLTFAGLPRPEVNAAVDVGEPVEVIGDLVYRAWHTVVEYDGGHHQEDRDQYNADIDRYALMRAAGVQYVQATKERLGRPRTFVGEVYRALLRGGYDGPTPSFESTWPLLFASLSTALGPRHRRGRARAVG